MWKITLETGPAIPSNDGTENPTTTHQQAAVVLTGTVMGGGPAGCLGSGSHARAGLPIYATPLAAAAINDDLSKVEALGIQIIDDEGAAQFPPEVCQICLRDFDFKSSLKYFKNSMFLLMTLQPWPWRRLITGLPLRFQIASSGLISSVIKSWSLLAFPALPGNPGIFQKTLTRH